MELQARGSHNENDNQGKIEAVQIGLFQADSLIARRAIERKSHFILSSDTDYFVHIGAPCVLIKSFKFARGRGRQKRNIDLMKITNIDIGVCALETKTKIMSALSENDKKQLKVVDAKFSLFAEANKFLRATIAVILGCVVFLSGIHNIDPSSVLDKVTLLKKEAISEEMIVSKMQLWACIDKEKGSVRLSPEIFQTFVKALVYEPANAVSKDGSIILEEDDSSPNLSLQSLTTNLQNYFPVCRAGQSLHHLMKTKNLLMRI